VPELEPIFVQTVTSTNRYLPVSRTARCLMNVCRSPSLLSLFFLATACSSDPAGPPPAGDGNAEVEWVAIATGLSDPIFLTAPSGDPRLFVALQGGVIRIIDNGQELSTSFIDINNQVQSGGERGLLGVAFHPDYAANGYVYLHYSDNNGDTQVDRFTVSSNVNVLSVGSQTPIISVPQPFSNHNGGMLAFGVDGMLYLALGDGGSGGDPLDSGQTPTTLLGSILRLDVDGGTPYAVPSDNPFVGSGAGADEVWAYGLRNPWRFSFDSAAGHIYIGDVGQNAFEEIDVEPADAAGRNYGWNTMEGTSCFGAGSCNMNGLTLPVLAYDNPDDGCAVVGGYVYRGSAIPTLQGHYFYSDACSGWLRSFRYDNGLAADQQDWNLMTSGVRSFGVDADGELYLLAGSSVFQLMPLP
jgi:glucose/arabinose dehydrogenase